MRELDIRRSLIDAVRGEHHGDPDTLIVEELGLCEGTARVDVAVVNGKVHGFEIKSRQDTLVRLPGQTEIYQRALDRVTMVVDGKHLGDVRALVPKWWGIIEAKSARVGGVAFRVVRKSRDNPEVDRFAQVQLLWRDEALAELARRSLDRGVSSKPRREIWRRLAETLTPDELGDVVQSNLKNRPCWRAES